MIAVFTWSLTHFFFFSPIFQAPALCFYNNAVFSDNDWRGIRMIYSSVKEEDPLKVGRFGLGFKSVFHITGRKIISYHIGRITEGYSLEPSQ